MIARILRPDEYDRLIGTELEPALPYLTSRTTVFVVEDGDQLVGCWSLTRKEHAEGLWIHPDHRGRTAVWRHLTDAMRTLARSRGEHSIVTASMDPGVTALILRSGGVALPGEHFVVPIGEP